MRSKTVLVFLGAAALAASAVAQTKTSGTAQCKSDPPAPVEVGDKPGHAFNIGKGQCTWTGFTIAGVAYKDGLSISTEEMDGDKTTAHFHGTGTSKDGKFVSGGGTWTFSSGTGKCKGIKGKGTYKGTPNADGTVTFKVDGEYSLAK